MYTYIPADHAPAVPGEISGIKGSAQIESGCLMDGGFQVGHSLVEWCGAVKLSSDGYKSNTSMQLCPVQSIYQRFPHYMNMLRQRRTVANCPDKSNQTSAWVFPLVNC